MVQCEDAEVSAPRSLLVLPRGSSKDEAFEALDAATGEAENYAGLDASLLACEIDTEVADKVLAFASGASSSSGRVCRLSHNDLASGTDTEQRLLERLAERALMERQLNFHQEAKRKAASEKDFAVSAGKRKNAENGITVTTARLAALDGELEELDRLKKDAPWYMLFSHMEARGQNGVQSLDLTNCGLHATGLVMLTKVLLAWEQRADCEPVAELVLDGNDVGDAGMTCIANMLRLTSHLKSLRLRNVGLTERGVSQVLSGLVSNKTLALLDLRSNGLSSPEVGKSAVAGVKRFNPVVEVLLE